MDSLTSRTADLLGLADVERWVVIKTQYRQSVAEHSFAVAVIAMELAERLGMADGSYDRHDMIVWALCHDVPEVLTGDIDGKFKRDFPSVREVVQQAENKAFPWVYKLAERTPPHCRALVKTADYIEAITFIQRWGVGSRADSVFRELTNILMHEQVPKLIVSLRIAMNFASEPGADEMVERTVKQLLDHVQLESGCCQFRRYTE